MTTKTNKRERQQKSKREFMMIATKAQLIGRFQLIEIGSFEALFENDMTAINVLY